MKFYKITSIIILFGFNINLFSQVGINTSKPERALDVNGNLKVRNLADKTADESYNKVLVTDAIGNLETVDKATLKNKISEEIPEIKRLFYTSERPNPDNKLKCGRFEFSFRDGKNNTQYPNKNLDIMLNLSSDPKKEITTYFTLFRKWGDNDLNYYKSNGKTYNSNNYQTPQLLCPQLDINSTGEFYISYPNENNFYRVLFLARPNYIENNITYNSYTITCEKL